MNDPTKDMRKIGTYYKTINRTHIRERICVLFEFVTVLLKRA